MKKYVIERTIPGAGKFSPQQLQEISAASCGVLSKIGSQIQWVHSYVTGDKIYCVYNSANEDLIREHAHKSGFQADVISTVSAIIDPVTAG